MNTERALKEFGGHMEVLTTRLQNIATIRIRGEKKKEELFAYIEADIRAGNTERIELISADLTKLIERSIIPTHKIMASTIENHAAIASRINRHLNYEERKEIQKILDQLQESANNIRKKLLPIIEQQFEKAKLFEKYLGLKTFEEIKKLNHEQLQMTVQLSKEKQMEASTMQKILMRKKYYVEELKRKNVFDKIILNEFFPPLDAIIGFSLMVGLVAATLVVKTPLEYYTKTKLFLKRYFFGKTNKSQNEQLNSTASASKIALEIGSKLPVVLGGLAFSIEIISKVI